MRTPLIDPMPSGIREGAAWIWKWQDLLNAAALRNKGTIAIGLSPDATLRRNIMAKYLRAFASEMAENFENFFWKHWGKESLDGHYFELVPSMDGILEHSEQNIRVEMTDMLFFLVSFLQAAGYNEKDWIRNWSSGDGWRRPKKLFDPDTNAALVDGSMECFSTLGTHLYKREGLDANSSDSLDNAVSLFRETCALVYEYEVIHRAYAVKLQINFERLDRGRKQMGDTLSEIENLRV